MLFKSVSTRSPSMEKSLSKTTSIYQWMGIQYFSILPETLEATSRTNSLNRKFKWIFAVNIMMTICESCAFSFAIYLSKRENRQGNVATGQIVQFAVSNLLIVVLVATILNSLLLRQKTRQIFKNCKFISKSLLSLNQCVDYKAFADEFKKSLAKLLLCLIVSFSAGLLFNFLSNSTNAFLWTIFAIYPHFFIVITFSYWTFLIRLVREQLRFVKDSLVQLQKNVQIFRIDPEIRNHDSRLRRNHETYNFFVKLKRIYGVIYETSLIVNEFIAVPICLIIIFVLISNVSSGYKVFLSLRNDVPMERVVGPIFAIFIMLASLCTLIFSCSSTYAANNDVLRHLHKFECNKLEREFGISAILTEFSTQIVQQPIEFTVGGFCYLTQPFLATIITGAMTYVMLLVQFSTS
ncbi:uncharacterized protein LOC119083224 [Bradysia coprophila]|uniref:uncharacterized protein LOC119083224 n=1 Tax=Bradysia coprophila TaxID=38358 RepID=UPI00187D77DA|nr:uncharacterized protein LOC119083224 [Bradysia coprophila]